MEHTIADVVAAMRRMAPEEWAEEWDNVGWLVRRDAPMDAPLKAILSLDPVDPDWAAANGYRLNVCHHPNPFRGLTRVDDNTYAARAWAAGLNVYAAHTNLDAAPGGVNDALASALGLSDTRPMLPCDGATLVKFVTYVPEPHLSAVRTVCAEAGAGHIGNYDECSFAWPGTGTFRPLPGADPYTRTEIGRLEETDEWRLEMIVPSHLIEGVIAAANAAHPYEEIAYDVIPLANPDPRVGIGRIGTLPEPMELAEFCKHVSLSLRTDRVSAGGSVDSVRTVAVLGGAGGKYLSAAGGADVFVTGEVGHHDALEAQAMGMAIIDAGHFATERVVLEPLKRYLEAQLRGLNLTIADETDPLRRA
ncbi:MAG TPA: Nif3-like dinuclear metal center hexameric protein [Armatimonadota bacterium]|jgi:dinuclear metal center YbgI/SA1388 family protein